MASWATLGDAPAYLDTGASAFDAAGNVHMVRFLGTPDHFNKGLGSSVGSERNAGNANNTGGSGTRSRGDRSSHTHTHTRDIMMVRAAVGASRLLGCQNMFDAGAFMCSSSFGTLGGSDGNHGAQ